MEKLGYLGPAGTNSYLAAQKLRPDAVKVEFRSFHELVAAVADGQIDCAVIPVENSLNGAVAQNLDLLQASGGLFAYEACTVKIDHRLATLEGADKSKIKRIYSHPQALEQCAGYLARNFPAADKIAVSSTAESLKMINSQSDAGIVGGGLTAKGIVISDESVADNADNYTLFLLVCRGGAEQSRFSERVFFSLVCRHKAGELLKLLKILSDGGANMTKIESRPIKHKAWEYRFFIEIEGDYSSPSLRQILNGLESAAEEFKLFGAYTVKA